MSLLSSAPAAASARPEAVIARAAAAGLPTALLQRKTREGRAKRIAEARITSLLRTLARYMERARARLRAGKRRVPATLLEAMALARLAGVPRAHLRVVAPRGSRADAAARVEALAELHVRGFRERALARLLLPLSPQDLLRIGANLERLRRRGGLTHAEVTDRVLRRVGRGEPLPSALRHVEREAARRRATPAGRAKGRRR